MRLGKLTVERYGPFAAQHLALSTEPNYINLVTAPNGAGKSVLRQAITELLFGIHPQTPMRYEGSYDRMRLHAEIKFPDGDTIGFVRRKGATNTLTDPAGRPVHPSLPDRLPRATERERLSRLFVLDSSQLRQGGKALLQTDGDLADALLSSAGDLGSARGLATGLAAQRDAAAPKRRVAKTPYYEAGDAWSETGKRLAASLARPPAVAALEHDRNQAQQALAVANAQAKHARDQAARLARVRATQRHLRDLDQATAWLDQHPHAPILPTAAAQALATAKTQAASAANTEQTKRSRHGDLATHLNTLAVDTAILAQADAIARLTGTTEQTRSSHRDLPKLQAERDAAEASIALLLRQLSSPATPASAIDEVRPAEDIEAARNLIAQLTDLETDRASATGAANAANQAIRDAEAEQAILPAPAATEALRAAYEEATRDGDAANLMRTAQAELADAATAAAAALRQVPGWTADAAALTALPVPAIPTLDRLHADMLAKQGAAGTAATRQTEAAAELHASRTRVTDARGARPLPDAAAVAAARANRDRGWTLIAARLAGTPDPAAEADWAALPLTPAFTAAIAAADDIADRRAEEMGRIERVAELQAAADRNQATLDADIQAAAAAAQDAARAEAAWTAATAPLGLAAAATLAEARGFLLARDQTLAAADAHRSAQARVTTLADRHAGWAARLSTCLDGAQDTLLRLTLAAKHRLDRAVQAEEQAKGLARSLAKARRSLKDVEPALAAATAALAQWTQEWQAVLARLRLPPTQQPAIAAAVLDRLVELPDKVGIHATATGRVADVTRQLAQFAKDVAALATQLGEDSGDPLDVAARLAARLQAAQAADSARQIVAKQAGEAAAAHQVAITDFSGAQHELDCAVAGAGAANLEDAEARIAIAAERQAHAEAHAAALDRLREDGKGLDLATLRQDAEAHPAITLDDAEQVAEAAAAAASQAAQDAATQIERAEGSLRDLAAGQEAARAAAERQAAAARLARVLDDAMVQHLAATMLDHALAEVEAAGATNQRLTRIGETFAALTGGAYDRLSPAGDEPDNKDYGRLIAHEAGGAERHIARLSEGTRDQLYLALRLVAVQDHIKGAPPLPFIADDILQTFDDTRARAALEALVRLSEHVQVIVLTHHPHLAALAQGLPVHAASI